MTAASEAESGMFQATFVVAGTIIDEYGRTDVGRLRDIVNRTRERAQAEGRQAIWNQPELQDLLARAEEANPRPSYDTDLYLLVDIGSLRFNLNLPGEGLAEADLLVQAGLVTYYRVILRRRFSPSADGGLGGVWNYVQRVSLQLSREVESLGLVPQMEGITIESGALLRKSAPGSADLPNKARAGLEAFLGDDMDSVRAASLYFGSIVALVGGPTTDRYIVISPPHSRELIVSTALYLLLAKRRLLGLKQSLNVAYERTIQVRRKDILETDISTVLPHVNEPVTPGKPAPTTDGSMFHRRRPENIDRDVRIAISRRKLDELLDARRLTEHAADRFLSLSHQVKVVTDFVSFNLSELLDPSQHRPVLPEVPTVCKWEREKLGDYREPLDTLVQSLLKEVEETRRFIANISDVYSVYLNLDLQVRFERLYQLGVVIAIIGVILTAVTILR